MRKMKPRSTRRTPLTPKVLVEVCGERIALELIRRFGGSVVPRNDAYLTRRREIVDELQDGATYSQVAARHGLTRQAVARLAS